MRQLTNSAICTDSHFGKKNNSDQHNQDIIDYLNWFAGEVRLDPTIDSIVFMGDWFENRSAIDIKTLRYAHEGGKILNDLGLPVFFLVGNHDLYQRFTRDVFSTAIFHEFKNFQVIDHPQVVKNLGGGCVLSPYVFDEEYKSLTKFNDVPVWFGHFEFKNFQITGYNTMSQRGLEAAWFKKPSRIFTGHFHKRQIRDNIIYVGSIFPMDFGDAGDSARGMAVFDHVANRLKFIDWPECPKYAKINLSTLVDGKIELPKHARVKCNVDFTINFEESNHLKQFYLKKFDLREFTLEESVEVGEAFSDTEIETGEAGSMGSIDDMIVDMLGRINTKHINNDLLLELYREL